MLVLSRKRNQRILIGDSIVITVIEVESGRARIGVSAPKGVRVDREEVRERSVRGSDSNHERTV
jgi:carbon storage regulator